MQSKTSSFSVAPKDITGMAKALGHPARVEILRALAQKKACICGEVVDELPLAQATVSQHLKVLKDAGFISGNVDGPAVCYCLNTAALKKVGASLGALFEEIIRSAECC